MRVKIGKEFEVANRISKRFLNKPKIPFYYTCFGQYDLVEFLVIDSYEGMNNMPFDEDIINCEVSLFYSWENISNSNFNEWTEKFPVLLLVLLKIQPSVEEKFNHNVEYNLINYIKMVLGNKANLFAGMGQSDILLILRDKGLENILPIITKLRQDITLENVIEGLSKETFNPELPVFIDSTTFPLIAHPTLKEQKEFSGFEGKVLPRIDVMCNPGYEKNIVEKRPASCSGVYNFYGNYDVSIIWNKKIELSLFIKELTNFRQNIAETEGLENTVTTFLGLENLIEEIQSKKGLLKLDKLKPEVIPGTKKIYEKLEKSEKLDPVVRSRLIESLGVLNSYYIQPYLKPSFEDMTGICFSINWGLDSLMKASRHQISRINDYLSEIIDLSNNALFQRYAGLENHFPVFKHLPYPFLKGINSFIAAATCVPNFIFKAIIPEKKLKETWSGFVLFGLSYSYQLYNGRILSYPASSLQKPIEDWWGITHEIAHAIYNTFDFYNKELPEDIRKHLDKRAVTQSSLLISIEEIYANWFDFRYIFRKDKNRYFPIIWKSWLRWDRVWRVKDQYLFRSLVIFITTDLLSFREAINKGFDELKKYTEIKFKEMENIIKEKVPYFNEFVDEFAKNTTQGYIEEWARLCDGLEVILNYLEYDYFDNEIYMKLNPDYPEELLRKHINNLEEGIIIDENLPDPIRLLHELYDRYTALERNVPLKTTAATILTLCLKYFKEYKS